MKFSIAYLLTVVLTNIGFAHIPLFHGWPPMSLVVGLVFVLRDFAQREVGHGVLLLMLAGAILSYFMASPAVAIASCAAYLAGETIDWLVYTFMRRPLHERVVASSLLGAPVDSAVFLLMLGFFSWPGALLMTASKMVGAISVALMLNRTSPDAKAGDLGQAT